MKTRYIVVMFAFCSLACKKEVNDETVMKEAKSETKMPFDKNKWNAKDDEYYISRKDMLNALLESDTLKKLKKDQIFEMLGEPNRIDNNHLFYTISQKHIGFVPFQTKTLVIKLRKDNSVEWVKTHG